MLTQLFNPTEIKKNGPATRPAIAPARRSASPLQAALAVLPATSQSYGAARVIVNGDHHRWWLCIPHEFPATLPCVPGGRGSSLRCAPTPAKSVPGVVRELGLTPNQVLGTKQSIWRPDHRGRTTTPADRFGHGDQTTVAQELDAGRRADLGHGGEGVARAVSAAPSGEARNAGSARTAAVLRCEARAAASASGSDMPRSMRLTRICSTVVMMVEPPGDPSASNGWPWRARSSVPSSCAAACPAPAGWGRGRCPEWG